MKHIVYLTSEYPKKGLNGGGIGSFVQFLSRNLLKKGFKVSVIGINSTFDTEIENDDEISIYRLAKSRWKLAKFYDHTNRILKKINELDKEVPVDIVEGSEADHYIAVSNYVGSQTQKYLKFNFDYKTIYNSVDTDKFSMSKPENIKKNTLLFVGTVCEKKGIRQLVQAMQLIQKEVPTIKLKIVGRDWKDKAGNSFTTYLKTYINEELKEAIEIVGPVPHTEVSSYIEKAHICVYPSHMEAMPIAWLEALAMGKTLVASDIAPGHEAVINGVTGLLVNPFDIKGLASSIVEVLNNKNFHIYGKAAREDIISRFNVDSIIAKNIEYYNKILS